MITVAAVVALACCAFMAQGDRALRESDEYWDAVEAEEVGIDWSKGRSAPKTYDLMKRAAA